MTVNVQEEMNNSINILLDTNKLLGEYEYALDVIDEYVDEIDYANDFQKLGGFQVIPFGLKSVHNTVRAKTAEVIGTLVQNNPYCQEKFMECPAYLNLLIFLVGHDDVPTVRVRALHALSCLVRQTPSIFWKFIDAGGIEMIVDALKSSVDKLQIKATFLVCSTCHLEKDIADLYVSSGVVEILCSIIKTMEKTFDSVNHELFLTTLSQLLKMSPVNAKEICTSDKDLKASLLSLQESYPSDNSYRDEKDQITWLMETLVL